MFEIDFKVKNILAISLNENQFLYFFNYNSDKKMWDILEIIYGVSSNIKEEGINT